MKPALIDFHGASLTVPSYSIAGTYEALEMHLAEQAFTPDDRVLVAGVGMGWLLAWIAAIVGPEHVVGYEPIPGLALLVRENVQVNHQTLDVRVGALDLEQRVKRLSHPANWATSSLLFTPEVGVFSEVPTFDVRGICQDDQITALALDVEGYERVLLPELLHCGLRTLLVEVHGKHLSQPEQDGLRGAFLGHGYSIDIAFDPRRPLDSFWTLTRER